MIRFKVLPNGRVIDMQFDGRSGDTASIARPGAPSPVRVIPRLPPDFHGPWIELRAYFLYNMQPR